MESTERGLLKDYLGRYKRAKDKKEELEARVKMIRADIRFSDGRSMEDETSLKARISEIEARIDRQKDTMAKFILETMDIMDYLPSESLERSILEMRHIDCLSWREICRRQHMSRTPCCRYYRDGLDTILQNKRVRKILKEYEESGGKGEKKNEHTKAHFNML